MSSNRFMLYFAMALNTCFASVVDGKAPNANTSNPRCKYSVRDVAFVNVHGKSWQLEIVKPTSVTEAEFSRWNQTLKTGLATTNLGYVWLDPDSSRAEFLRAEVDMTSDLNMYLTNDAESIIPFSVGTSNFTDQIETIVHSPIRKELLNQLTDSLCVFVLVTGDDESKNEIARRAVDLAIQQTEKQLWMMEKASSKGPSVVEIEYDNAGERVTLRTAGIGPLRADELPAVAIMFGQARRLGDVITRNEISKDRLISLAALCGSDCECELDRDWLYGDQMVHDWTIDLERDAERELSFDPKSAFVVAEIAQIMRKNNSKAPGNSFVDMGAGLVIHDLDAPESEDLAGTAPPIDRPEKAVSTDLTTAEKTVDDEINVVTESPFNFPLYLIAGLAVVTVLTIVIVWHKNS